MWLLSEATGVDVSVISPGSYRAPVRPLPLKVLAATDETDGDRATWPTWLHAVPDDVLHRYRLGRNGEDGGAVPEGVSR